MKQHMLSGHWYLSIINFMFRFYVVKIKPKSRPYTAFYVEGLGHFWYVRMLFGLTGAPTAFTTITATHLHDLIVEEVLKIFMDNGGIASDTFSKMMDKLTKVLGCVHE
jgi:hypothetical protein